MYQGNIYYIGLMLLVNFPSIASRRALVSWTSPTYQFLLRNLLSSPSTGIDEDCPAAQWPSSAGSVLTELCRHTPLQAGRWCKRPPSCTLVDDKSLSCWIVSLYFLLHLYAELYFGNPLDPPRKHSLATSLHWVSWLRLETVSDNLMSTWELQSVGFCRKNLTRYLLLNLNFKGIFLWCIRIECLPLCVVFQALDSLQRAQELADGMGNKVTDVTPDTSKVEQQLFIHRQG